MQALTIQIPLSALRYPSSASILVLLQHANLLERLHNLAVDATAGIDMVTGTTAGVLPVAVHFPQTSYADGLAEVDMSRHRCGSDVEPEGPPDGISVRLESVDQTGAGGETMDVGSPVGILRG